MTDHSQKIDLIAIERQAQRMRAEALAHGFRVALDRVKSLFASGAHGTASKTA